MANKEKLSGGKIENINVLSEDAGKHAERLLSKLEHEKGSEDKEKAGENARHEVKAVFEAQNGNRGNLSQSKHSTPSAKPMKRAPKEMKEKEYKKTLKTIQKDMNPAERTVSKIIHNPVVEKTSEVASATVARPAAILAGSLSALIVTSAIYIIAKTYGYVLSGSEWIFAFFVGWAIGLIIDWIRVALLGKRAGPA